MRGKGFGQSTRTCFFSGLNFLEKFYEPLRIVACLVVILQSEEIGFALCTPVKLQEFHRDQQTVATMCVREHSIDLPFGVVQTDAQWFVSIREKPTQRFFINAGIYVLEPEALSYIPDGSKFDMPDLFEKLMTNEKATSVFPIREDWIDVGRMEDLERARLKAVKGEK